MSDDVRSVFTELLKDHAEGRDMILRIEANRRTTERITGSLFDNASASPLFLSPLFLAFGVSLVVVDAMADGEWKVVRRIDLPDRDETAAEPVDLEEMTARLMDMMPPAVRHPSPREFPAIREFLGAVNAATERPEPFLVVGNVPVRTRDHVPDGTWGVVAYLVPEESDISAPRGQDPCPQCGAAWVGDRPPCGPAHRYMRANLEGR
jgi:hypothetical protein